MILGKRLALLLIFIICANVIGYALYLQLVINLLPCPLCIAQRIAYWLIGLTALFYFIHYPQNLCQKIYSIFMVIFSLLGLLLALHHSWLIAYSENFECGISAEEEFINNILIAKWWPIMFEANGDCADIEWEFIFLTIPNWSAIFFLVFSIFSVYILFANNN
ncbi:MAG: disulfide bond formation protein B [Nitrosomonadaceae bacterium]|nr:disulfide bond formation protein B [Nitrosomonadaceae bacterium]|tara:strand:+ start:35592 stop:36080 length:489 start_codon:yes stop_codon:yes gene_type:complete